MSLNGADYAEDSCAEFCPAASSDFSVLRTANSALVSVLQHDALSDHVTRRVLRHSVHTDGDPRPYDVTQLQFHSWKMYDQVYTAHLPARCSRKNALRNDLISCRVEWDQKRPQDFG